MLKLMGKKILTILQTNFCLSKPVDHKHFASHFSINHDDDFILETSDLPDHLVTTVGGNVLFEQELPMVNMSRNM